MDKQFQFSAREAVSDYKQIIAELGQEKIMSYYLNLPIDYNKLTKSPLRKDNKPTCGFYKSKSDKLYYHDFALFESYDVMSVIMKRYSLDFYGAVRKLIEDYINI